MTKSFFEDTRKLALAYIAKYYTNSIKLRKYLHKKLHNAPEEQEIDAVINWLKEYDLINDYKYALNYFQRMIKKGNSIGKIKYTLIQKDISKTNIEEIINNIIDANELNNIAILYCIKRKNIFQFSIKYDVKKQVELPMYKKDNLFNKDYNKLSMQGFNFNDIQSTFNMTKDNILLKISYYESNLDEFYKD